MERGSGSVPIVVEEEKLRGRLHPDVSSPGRCQARCASHAFPKGMNGPQLRFPASWGRATPASFDAAPLGTYPQGRRLFLMLLFALLHAPLVVDWLPVPSEQHIALHSGSTRSCFYPRPYAMEPIHDSVVQGATSLFSHGYVKPEVQGLKPKTPNHWG